MHLKISRYLLYAHTQAKTSVIPWVPALGWVSQEVFSKKHVVSKLKTIKISVDRWQSPPNLTDTCSVFGKYPTTSNPCLAYKQELPLSMQEDDAPAYSKLASYVAQQLIHFDVNI